MQCFKGKKAQFKCNPGGDWKPVNFFKSWSYVIKFSQSKKLKFHDDTVGGHKVDYCNNPTGMEQMHGQAALSVR